MIQHKKQNLKKNKLKSLQLSLLLAVVCLLLFSFVEIDKPKDPPNIIIIFADDLGYGDLSCYGHPTIVTKHIDKMAREGIRFTSFYATASVCTPSRASLLTGRYPIRNLPHNLGPESKTGLPLSEITIADVLKKEDYSTMAVGKWHLGHMEGYLPTSRGFDQFYGLPYSNDMILPWCPWLSETDTLFLYENEKKLQEIGFDQGNLTVNYTNQAVKFIEENASKPFFLYFAQSMPHLPISTSEEFLGKSKGGLYGDVIETIDWSVGQIMKTLKEKGIDENTIVVFTSDNGPWQNLPERMLQKGVEHWHAGTAGLLRGAKMSTYEGGFRVPAIMRWPGHIEEGITTSKTANTMDLFTTLIGATGAEPPKEIQIDGRDIMPLLLGDEPKNQEPFFYLKGKKLEAVRKGSWKLRNTEDDGLQLFNLDRDPSEYYNVAEYEIEIVKDLQSEMKQFADETNSELVE